MISWASAVSDTTIAATAIAPAIARSSESEPVAEVCGDEDRRVLGYFEGFAKRCAAMRRVDERQRRDRQVKAERAKEQRHRPVAQPARAAPNVVSPISTPSSTTFGNVMVVEYSSR